MRKNFSNMRIKYAPKSVKICAKYAQNFQNMHKICKLKVILEGSNQVENAFLVVITAFWYQEKNMHLHNYPGPVYDSCHLLLLFAFGGSTSHLNNPHIEWGLMNGSLVYTFGLTHPHPSAYSLIFLIHSQKGYSPELFKILLKFSAFLKKFSHSLKIKIILK